MNMGLKQNSSYRTKLRIVSHLFFAELFVFELVSANLLLLISLHLILGYACVAAFEFLLKQIY
jgi:hypothetical protein